MKLHASIVEAQKISEHDVSAFYEYPIDFDKASMGVSEIHGRYPQSGYDVDTKVEALWYVLEGAGQVSIADEMFTLNPGDIVRIPQNSKIWIEGDGLKLVVVSCPPWFLEQHKHLDE